MIPPSNKSNVEEMDNMTYLSHLDKANQASSSFERSFDRSGT